MLLEIVDMISVRLFFAQSLTAVMMIAGLLVGFQYDWPDYVHTDYGFPLIWATYTTSTIVGPADIWRLNLTNMVIDLAVWGVSSLIVVMIVEVLKRKRRTA